MKDNEYLSENGRSLTTKVMILLEKLPIESQYRLLGWAECEATHSPQEKANG